MEGLVGSLIVGGIAGWLAGQIMKGKGHLLLAYKAAIEEAA